MSGVLWRIDAPHFCCGVIVERGRVVEAAPIVSWATGKRWGDVKSYMARKGWHGAVVG